MQNWRKFSAVLGTTSLKSSKVIRPSGSPVEGVRLVHILARDGLASDGGERSQRATTGREETQSAGWEGFPSLATTLDSSAAEAMPAPMIAPDVAWRCVRERLSDRPGPGGMQQVDFQS